MKVSSIKIVVLSLLFACYSVSAKTTADDVNAQEQSIASEETSAEAIEENLLQGLVGAKLKAMPEMIKGIANRYQGDALNLLNALIEGRLYYVKSTKQPVIVDKMADGSFSAKDPLTLAPIGNFEKSAVKKIRSNNRLRKQARQLTAEISLQSTNDTLREEAINTLIGKVDKDSIALLEQAKVKEKNKSILALIDVASAIYYFQHSDDTYTKVSALKSLEGNVHQEVRNLVAQTLRQDDDGKYLVQDKQVLAQAIKLQKAIDGKVKFYGFLEQLFFGLSLGSVLLLVATGLAITFGVMGVINMAHGELIMLGAYTTYVIQLLMPNAIEYSVLIAIPAAFIVSGFVGILIERGVIQFLHGRPLETLLATFGISLILQQAVRSIFSPLNRQVETPQWLSGSLEITPLLSITYNRLYILIFALIVFFILQLILKRTSLGLHVRAVSQNRNMAKAIGIRTEWVDALTFGLGSGIAGVAGVALSQLTNVGPNLGQAYIIDSFMVVVFGGAGNLWGTLVGGFTLGITNKFLEPLTGAVLANIIVLVFIILFIQKRPRGLFPQKGRAAE